MDSTKILAQYIVDLKYEDLTPRAVDMAKKCLLDFLSCCIRGSLESPAQIIRDVVQAEPSESKGATVLCEKPYKTGSMYAALCNGVASHALDMDDVVNSCYGHPGPTVIPAALAVAEKVGATGKELITAVAAGYEVMVRIAESVLPDSYFYWHTTATTGNFGAAAAAGKLLNLNTRQMVQCLGSAGTQAAGLFEFLIDGANSKTLHAGKAAFNGALSAYLSQRGFTAANKILEGEKGFCHAMIKEPKLNCITDHLGGGFKIEQVSFKPYACCRWTHSLINGALILRKENGIDHKTIRSIKLKAHPTALNITDNKEPKTVYGCKFSMQYCVAAALIFGKVGVEEFNDENINREDIRRLISVTDTKAVEIRGGVAEMNYAEVDIEMDSGMNYHKVIPYALGDPTNPMTFEDMQNKFRDLVSPVYAEDKLQALIDFAGELDGIHDVSSALTKVLF